MLFASIIIAVAQNGAIERSKNVKIGNNSKDKERVLKSKLYDKYVFSGIFIYNKINGINKP